MDRFGLSPDGAKEASLRSLTHLLAATDFSEDAGWACQRAALLAAEHGASLELLHVLNDASLLSLESLLDIPRDIDQRLVRQAEDLLQVLVADIAATTGVQARVRVVVGKPVEEIAAAGGEADLTVMGARGSTGLRELVLGSTAERVLRKSRVPVLIVKSTPRGRYERVLVPLGFGPHGPSTLQATLAVVPDADVTLFHAYAVPYEATLRFAGVSETEIERYRQEARGGALEWIDELLAPLGAAGSRFHRAVAHGEAGPAIVAKQAELGSDLIVMGEQGSGLGEVLLGSVTREVLAATEADVLVVEGSRSGDNAGQVAG